MPYLTSWQHHPPLNPLPSRVGRLHLAVCNNVLVFQLALNSYQINVDLQTRSNLFEFFPLIVDEFQSLNGCTGVSTLKLSMIPSPFVLDPFGYRSIRGMP
jgi:hypothetical protein